MDKILESEESSFPAEQTSTPMEVPEPPTLPYLPLEIILELLEITPDLELVKACRLVSRSWNIISSKVLKKISAVRIDERDESSLEQFKQLLEDSQLSMPQEWPSPFPSSCAVVARDFTNSHFLQLIQSPTIKMTSLEIKHTGPLNSEGLEEVLGSPKTRIENLIIRGESYEDFPLQPPGTGWNWLQRLELSDNCVTTDGCPHTSFITSLGELPEVREIKLSGFIGNLFRFIAKSLVVRKDGSLDKLESFSCSFTTLSVLLDLNTFVLKSIGNIKARNLKKIQIQFPPTHPKLPPRDELTQLLLPLIQRCSENLEVLTCATFSPEQLPFCPKLIAFRFCLAGAEDFGSFPEHKLPYLRAICVRSYLTEGPEYAVHSQNSVVTLADVSFSNVSSVANYAVWAILAQRFPKLTKLQVHSQVESERMFQAIVVLFPKLKVLYLDDISEDILLGAPVHSLMEKGWPYEQVRGTSLLELTEIGELSLGKHVLVTLNVVTLCLAKLPKLSRLEFYWNEALNPNNIFENLGHLDKISIRYTDRKYKDILAQLSMRLSAVQLRYQKAE